MINSPSNKVDWITPKRIIDALGEFDLDPCCPPVMPWRTARLMLSMNVDCISYVKSDSVGGLLQYGDGLLSKWEGRVWLNPPYGKAQDEWLAKLSKHGNGIALIPVATSTKRWGCRIFREANAICFVSGRINFCDCNGNEIKGNNLDSALIAYGENNVQSLKDSGLGNTVVL